MRIAYKASVDGDLKRLDKQLALRIVEQAEKKLTAEGQSGLSLKGEFQGLYRLRFGDYRVIYFPTQEGFLILRIAHRKEVYRKGPPGR